MSALVIALALLAPSAPFGGRFILEVGGQARAYEVHVGKGAPARGAPLLLAIHGRGGSGAVLRASTRFDVEADRYGFVVAYPDAAGIAWRDLRLRTLPDPPADWTRDVDFLLRLVDVLVTSHGIDPRRVFVAGHSNGGFVALTLACTHAERIAGIAVVAANLPRAACAPSRPVASLFFHGTRDALVPYGGGGIGPRGARGFVASADETFAAFAGFARCAGETARPAIDADPLDGTRVSVIDGTGCAAPLRRVIVEGGGHGWPGRGDRSPHPTTEIDATATIGAFFFSGTGITP
jgi:polyhydroxybutyrate depolymerase